MTKTFVRILVALHIVKLPTLFGTSLRVPPTKSLPRCDFGGF